MYTKLRYYLISLLKTIPNEILRVKCATQRSDTILRRVCYIAKSDCYFHALVEHNSAPTGRIFMKFDIEVFFENLSRKFKFH